MYRQSHDSLGDAKGQHRGETDGVASKSPHPSEELQGCAGTPEAGQHGRVSSRPVETIHPSSSGKSSLEWQLLCGNVWTSGGHPNAQPECALTRAD